MDNNIESQANFIFYQSDTGNINVQVILDSKSETIWASQKAISKIFNIYRTVVTRYLEYVFMCIFSTYSFSKPKSPTPFFLLEVSTR